MMENSTRRVGSIIRDGFMTLEGMLGNTGGINISGENAGTVHGIDGFCTVAEVLDIGDFVVTNVVDRFQLIFGQNFIQKLNQLAACNGTVHFLAGILFIGFIDQPVFHSVIYIGFIPFTAKPEVFE